MRWTAMLLLASLALPLTACNTIKGMGTDIHDIAQNTQTFFESGVGYPTDSGTPSPSATNRAINRTAAAH